MIHKDYVWLITGCSKGLGRELARQVLHSGCRLVATARRPADLDDLVARHSDRALAIALDVTEPDQIAAAVKAAEERFGGVDVLVNNAGYGYLGAIEEGEDDQVRASFETNVFGPLNLIKAVLPGMRERKHGHIVNLSSIGGLVTYSAVGHYHMAKFAIEALSGTLAKELAPHGIDVTVVEPGAFRTDFRGPDSIKQSAIRLPAYEETAGKARDNTFAAHGKQPGDPVRAARAIIHAVGADKPPLHLVLGSDALDQARQHLVDLGRELEVWETLSRSTDFADAMKPSTSD